MNYFRILFVLIITFNIFGCGLFEAEIDKTKNWSEQKFYSEASEALKDGDYEQAIKYYEGLEARYPFGRYAMQAQLDVAYANYRSGETEAAIAAADRFIKLHPQDPHVDYAYYLKGLINYNRKFGFLDRYLPTDPSQRDPSSVQDSFQNFSELVTKFPNSSYAKDARQRMLYLRDNIAKNEIHAARYYLRRKAFLAAANRAKYVIENYPQTTVIRDALLIMIEAYRELGLCNLESDANRVLELNDANGTFVFNISEPESVTWGDWIWDNLELDKN
jgi:outer membrane protein assembly factor BamD